MITLNLSLSVNLTVLQSAILLANAGRSSLIVFHYGTETVPKAFLQRAARPRAVVQEVDSQAAASLPQAVVVQEVVLRPVLLR